MTRRYEEIEARLETIEERIGAIQEDMHACNDTIQLMTWQEEWDQLDQEQQLLMEEWESIAEQIES
ncbi:ATP-binding cassette, sub-family F,member 3 [Streptococcus pyogenes]|nr:ATP-binding cassette, sub-family F,member 3 [Streptococcus pyogenes]